MQGFRALFAVTQAASSRDEPQWHTPVHCEFNRKGLRRVSSSLSISSVEAKKRGAIKSESPWVEYHRLPVGGVSGLA
jgi:hypothetical protein